MGSYNIVFKKSVEKDLRKIDKSKVAHIVEDIEKLAANPFPTNSRKLVGAESAYRLRVGDYRVIYLVFTNILTIEIQTIRHRKDAYR